MSREYTPTRGDSPHMSDDNPQGPYAQRMMKTPPLDPPGPMQGMMPVSHLMEAHDRLAIVQERPCAPARGTERYRAAQKSIHEEGRKLSAANDTHLSIAHDALASHLGLECGYSGNQESASERRQIAEMSRQVEELKTQVVQQRKAHPYRPGSYLTERLKSLDWNELADRTAPLPQGLDTTLLLKEFEQLLALQYDDRYKILSYDLSS